MRKISKSIIALFVAIFALSATTPAFASENQDAVSTASFDQLVVDFNRVRNVPSNQYSEFIAENGAWIDEVSVRLDEFLATVPEHERAEVMRTLMSRSPLQRAASLSDYFHSHVYHVRGGYNTYSLDPVLSVRLWGPSMEAAWKALAAYYSPIANDNGSLWNQYKCHWDLVFENIWDIERGRPLVSYAATLAALCNPS